MTTKNKLAVFCCWPYGETMGVWGSSALVMPLGLDGPSLLQYYPSVKKKKTNLSYELVYVCLGLSFFFYSLVRLIGLFVVQLYC